MSRNMVLSDRYQEPEGGVASGTPRPALFRALGDREPPTSLQVDGLTYSRAEVFKHDSWAATVRYDRQDQSIVVKFNRQQAIFGMPMAWLGRILASRERSILSLLKEVDNIPRPCGDIIVEGKVCSTATGHEFVPGRPLRTTDRPDDLFWKRFQSLLKEVHARNIAYVDLHKCENILVGENGEPYLIDFQISAPLPQVWPLSSLFSILRQSDDYHLAKHQYAMRVRPTILPFVDVPHRPWWIKGHRCIAVPFRQARRRLLVLLGIRKGHGFASTEFAPEAGKRPASAA